MRGSSQISWGVCGSFGCRTCSVCAVEYCIVCRTGGRGCDGGSECRASNDQLEYTGRRSSSSCVEFSLGLTLPVKIFHDTTTTSRRPRCAAVHTSLRLLW